MITEQQQEQASLYAAGALPDAERTAFEAEVRASEELRALLHGLQRGAALLALSSPQAPLPSGLKDKVLRRIDATAKSTSSGTAAPATPSSLSEVALTGLHFLEAPAKSPWKALPVPGAYIKLLSLERERGYAVLLGKLDPGARYPAHKHAGPEDFFILTGDLVVGGRKLVAGDFHHADKGSEHAVNYSLEGCTLLAVLPSEDPLVKFAMA